MQVKESVFGALKNGRALHNYELINEGPKGIRVTVSEYGAVIMKIMVADKNDKYVDVALGFDKLSQYALNDPALGAPIGRVANRTAGASFTLNGKTYTLEDNDNGNNLHSSVQYAYFKRAWKFVEKFSDDKSAGVTFELESVDKDQGFPGNLLLQITYTVTENNALLIEYRAISDQDTPINLTNHCYFNLCGENTGNAAMKNVVWINSDYILENKAGNLPTGKLLPVKHTPFDFNKPKAIGADINSRHSQIKVSSGYDHCFVLKNNGQFTKVASCTDPESGRSMEVWTDLPGMQLYTTNFMDIIGKNGMKYHPRDAICFETEFFPDAIHFEQFKGKILKAGESFTTRTAYIFGIAQEQKA